MDAAERIEHIEGILSRVLDIQHDLIRKLPLDDPNRAPCLELWREANAMLGELEEGECPEAGPD